MNMNFRIVRSLILSSCVIGLCTCRSLVDPALPPDTQAFSAPVVYARWWAMTEACSGRHGSIESVSWFAVPGPVKNPTNGQDVNGYWSKASNQIVLSEDHKLNGGTVRHEMLHALVQNVGHSRAEFLGGCAGLVDCFEQCVADAGPAPNPPLDAINVTPDALEIGVDVAPLAPSMAQDGGAFTITVTARNPASHPVVVMLPPLPYGTPSKTFSFEVRGPSGSAADVDFDLDPSVTIFASGETKRKVFDFFIGNDPGTRALPPGTYTTVRGGYGERWVTHDAFVIQP